MADKQDKVIFGELTFRVPAGHTEQEIREALEENAPAIQHARANSTPNDNGTVTWRFTEVAGTKG